MRAEPRMTTSFLPQWITGQPGTTEFDQFIENKVLQLLAQSILSPGVSGTEQITFNVTSKATVTKPGAKISTGNARIQVQFTVTTDVPAQAGKIEGC